MLRYIPGVSSVSEYDMIEDEIKLMPSSIYSHLAAFFIASAYFNCSKQL